MHIFGVAIVARDSELRTMPSNGDRVCTVAVGFPYGNKGPDGRKPIQWADLSLFGKRAEGLAPYLVKGSRFFIVAENCHIEEFQRRDGTAGSKLVGRIQTIDFAGGGRDDDGKSKPAGKPAPQAPQGGGGFADFDDDIPF